MKVSSFSFDNKNTQKIKIANRPMKWSLQIKDKSSLTFIWKDKNKKEQVLILFCSSKFYFIPYHTLILIQMEPPYNPNEFSAEVKEAAKKRAREAHIYFSTKGQLDTLFDKKYFC